MKFIFELILTTVIVFFLWNMLKRLFYRTLFKFPPRDNAATTQQKPQQTKSEPKIHWDAETVDYEEVKETKESK